MKITHVNNKDLSDLVQACSMILEAEPDLSAADLTLRLQKNGAVKHSDPVIGFRGSEGLNVLHVACELSAGRVVEWLILHGKDINETNDNGKHAMHFAAGATAHGVSALAALLQHGADIEVPDVLNETSPLMMACHDPEKVAFLIERGASVTAGNRFNKTPLHFAVSTSSAQSMDVVNLLVKAGADVHAQQDDGISVLHRAAREGTPEGVLRLIELGADPNGLDKQGRSPLFECIKKDRLPQALVLLQHGADPEITNHSGATVFDVAAKKKEDDWFQAVKAWGDGKKALDAIDGLLAQPIGAPHV